ncbi:MAG: hypothetical protein NTV34_01640, partial [Proteobacteria bacterium]|nr:hypothetical protein [Pseudomonadota bacterium]
MAILRLCRGFFCVPLYLAGFYVAQNALGGVFELKFYDVEFPKDQGQCENSLRESASRFALAAGVSVLGSECARDAALDRLIGIISYTAQARVAVWSTESNLTFERAGFFGSLAKCQESLSVELETMKHLTGLEPFVSYCYRMAPLFTPERYGTLIQAVGLSGTNKYEVAPFLPNYLQNGAEVASTLTEQAANLGITVVSWAQQTRSSLPSFRFGFYASGTQSRHPDLFTIESWNYSSPAECNRMKIDFTRRVAAGWVNVAACTNSSPNSQLVILWWSDETGESMAVKTVKVPQNFASSESCQVAATGIEQ